MNCDQYTEQKAVKIKEEQKAECQALVDAITPMLRDDLKPYVRISVVHCLGDYSVDIVMVGDGIDCGQTAFYNTRWLHLAMYTGESKFEVVCGNYSWKSGVKKPTLRKQKTREVAALKAIEVVNNFADVFLAICKK